MHTKSGLGFGLGLGLGLGLGFTFGLGFGTFSEPIYTFQGVLDS